MATQQQTQQQTKPIEPEKIYQYINELCMPMTRENALLELRLILNLKNKFFFIKIYNFIK